MSYFKSKPLHLIWHLISRGHDRSVRAKKHILASLLVKGLSILISLVLVPLTIHYLNPTKYGIWITLSSIVGWFTLFDIGLGNGLRNKFAEAVSQDKHSLARTYVSTTYAIMSGIVLFLLIIFFLINPFLPWDKFLNAPSIMAGELRSLALIVFVFFCLQFVLNLISTVVTANQEPALASLINLLGSALSLILIFILTKFTQGNLVLLGAIFGIAPIIILAFSSWWFYQSKYRLYAPSIHFVKWSYAKDLASLGLLFFILQIASIVLYSTSNIIIAQLFGPSEVTPYNIAYKYFNIVPMVMGIIMLPFWSAYTDAWCRQDISWIKDSLRKLRLIWVGFVLVTILMTWWADPIYRLWVGSEVTVPHSISVVLALYVITYGWTSIYTMFLNGSGKIRLQLYISVFSMIINIPLAILLGKKIGIAGVILSTVLLGILNMIIEPIQTHKLINQKASGIWNQ